MKKELYVLTGFLGAGKTSLLLHLLENIKNRKIGVIQNEFGKISIDGEIIERGGIQMTEISRGSIFCSCLKLNFVQALAEMGKMDLDMVFVESSGLADPSNIEEILEAVKALAGDVYEFKAVVCLIDAVNFPEQLKDEETVDRQLAHCNLAVINKVDLISEEQLDALMQSIRKVNPVCPVKTCVSGRVDLSFLDEDLMLYKWAENEDSLNTVENRPKTFSIQAPEGTTKAELEAFLQKVLPDCYRIKGFMKLEDGVNQVDVVEKLVDIRPASSEKPSELVFLSKVGIKAIRTIDEAWKQCCSQPVKLRN